MKAMQFLPENAGKITGGAVNIGILWGRVKNSLRYYFNNHSEHTGYTRAVAYHTHKFIHALQKLPAFNYQLLRAKSRPRPDSPWQRQRFAFDSVMEAELVTIYGEQSTPLHSYDGPAGIIYVLDGELTVSRYTEISNEISACSGISKLNCETVNRYQLSQGTLIDAVAAPVVEMQANTERCVFLNIHLIDLPDHPHYFYYPSYISREKRQFFTRRVTGEW
ncbi:hypothetical protein [Kaarinaea lacus]